jgi:outer membrane protein OmpA-like peptidoglycan-associated protein/opacity protein-like surface antigen
MRKLAIAVALSTTVLAGPALARDGAWYVGGDFGPMIVEDTDADFTPGTTAGTTGAIQIGFDEGFNGSIFAGYDLGAFRIEAEVSYAQADTDELLTTGINAPGTAGTVGTFTGGAGDVTILAGMINAMLDFGDDDGLSGFVGGGIGLARVDFNDVAAFTNTGPVLDSSDTRLAWQIIAGVRQAISPNIDLHIKYRFFNVNDLEFSAFGGRTARADLRSHSLLGGITFNFGGVTVPPCLLPNVLDQDGICGPPPIEPCPMGTVRNANGVCVPAGPPPCPVGTERVPGTTECRAPERWIECGNDVRVREGERCPEVRIPPAIVYFGWDQDTLTAEARRTLDGVIQNAQRGGGQTQVVLAGHADRSGSATYNVGLSQRRANRVRDYLTAGGLSGGAITSQAFGEGRPAIETPDGVREPQNRRVEITFGPGSGW